MNRTTSDVRLFALWIGEQLRLILRTPLAVFFTIVFPLMLLTLFSALISGKDGMVLIDGGRAAFSQFFTPSIASFATLTACFTGLVIEVTMERDAGILKRIRSTPLPPGIYIAARIADRLILALAATIILFSVGVLAFGVDLYPRLLPAAIISFLVGAASFCALGMAAATLVPNSKTAVPVVNIIVFPMMVLSGVFSPLQEAPTWLRDIANVFPLSHMVHAFGGAFNPHTTGYGFAWNDLGVLVAWGTVAALIAVRKFRWEPAPAGLGRRGRRGGRALARA